MNSNFPITSPSVLQRSFVLVRANTLLLILPQTDILATEYLNERPSESPIEGLFDVHSNSELPRVAAISEEMKLLKEFPSDRFLVTILSGAHEDHAWVWNDMKVLSGQPLLIHPLPAICLATYSPVAAYVEYGDSIAFMCTAESLSRFAMAYGSQKDESSY